MSRDVPKVCSISRAFFSSATEQGKLQLITNNPPIDDGTNFFLPLEKDLNEIEDLFWESGSGHKKVEKGPHVCFRRGGVACGKSTMVQQLCRQKDGFVLPVHARVRLHS